MCYAGAAMAPVRDSAMEARRMKARVTVTLKSGVLDPQGKAIEGALRSLGVEGVASVRQGKVFDIELAGADQQRPKPRSRRPPTSSSPIR